MTQDVAEKAISEVWASTSLGSILPQDKVELAFKLLGVSSRVCRVLKYRSSSVLILLFFAGGTRAGGCPSPGRYKAGCSVRAGEDALIREGCSLGEA